MVDVDSLSDTELRVKLQEYGFPVMPITGSTRKTMARKLKLLVENKNKISKDSRRSLGRYSSEEESDSDARSVKRDKRRVTMGAPIMQPPSSKKVPAKIDVDSPAKKEIRTTTTTTRTSKIVQAARDEFDTGSESDDVAEKYPEVSYRRESPIKPPETIRKTPTPSRLPSSYAAMSEAANAASDRINQIKSRLSQYNSGYEKSLYTDDGFNDNTNTPFLSNFTKRLSQLSESPKSSSYDYKSDIIKENDVNGGSSSSRAYLNSFRAGRGRATTYDYKPTNQNLFKNNFVPFMVLVVAFLFFIVVAVVYLGIRSDTTLEVSATIPVCIETNSKLRRFVNCVMKEEAQPAIHLLQVLKPELDKRAVKNICEDGKVKPYMTENDIVSLITSDYAVKSEDKITSDLMNLEVLTFLNPIWGLNIIQLDEDGVPYNEDNIVESMEKVNKAKSTKVTALVSSKPYISWTCYFYNKIWSFLNLIISLSSGILVLGIANTIYQYYKKARHRQHEELITLVEQIIDVLQSNCSDNEDNNYMVINHVRDMLLPVHERKNKQKLWAMAVKYIDENESRIRVEVQTVRGEPSEVWRWLGGPNLTMSKNKSWQGQAFETQVGAVNSLLCSPTPCLKIRGMMGEEDRNTLAIKKAVLGKCAQECRILHCGIDTNTNCVYLKCADPSDAAVAYRNLHGWWYAGNLVTVKYLRLERYMQRFPEAPVSGPPFLQ